MPHRPRASEPQSLATVLARAGAYVADFHRQLSSIVGEERYVQDWTAVRSGRHPVAAELQHRELVSDVVLVKPPRADAWMTFRDVFEVNGNAVRDRDDRLAQLIRGGSPSTDDAVRTILDESSRYNIGDIKRNLNTPVLTLLFLELANQPRFKWARTTDNSLATVPRASETPGAFRVSTEVWVVAYDEKQSGTMIRYHRPQGLSGPRPLLDRTGDGPGADERAPDAEPADQSDNRCQLSIGAAAGPAGANRDARTIRGTVHWLSHRGPCHIRPVSAARKVGTMPARPTWKGYLKISLVNIPIKVFPATDAGATLSFNQLHGECQTRIQQKRWCPKCEREVPNTDIVKGFEFEKGRYVVVDEEDIEKVRVDSTRVINLEKFTDDTAIDPIYLERPYYLAPDGPVAREAFAVIREGMKGKAGIGKVALYGREYLVKVQPREKGLVMYTLRHANEIRSMDAIDELSDMPAKVKPEEVKLAHQVMGTFEGTVDLEEYRDDYQVGLREIIDAKIEGREIVAPEVEAPPKVVNLMEALRKSLDTISASKKPAATVSRMTASPKKRAGARG